MSNPSLAARRLDTSLSTPNDRLSLLSSSLLLLARDRSGRIDHAHGDQAQRSQGRDEEVVAAPGLHEGLEIAHNVRGLARCGSGGNDVALMVRVIAQHGTGVVAQVEVQPVLDPLLLDELELPEDVGADRHEDDALLGRVITLAQRGGAVGQAAAQDPPALVELGRGRRVRSVGSVARVQVVAGVDPPQVGAQRALDALHVVTVAKVRGLDRLEVSLVGLDPLQRLRRTEALCLAKGLPGLVGRHPGKRDTVGPATGHLGHERFLCLVRLDAHDRAVARGLLVQDLAKRAQVLVQLAIDHEGAIVGQILGHGGRRQLLALVGVAEDKFAGRQRHPAGLLVHPLAPADHPRGHLGRGDLALEDRIANPVGEAEVLLARGDLLVVGQGLEHNVGGLILLVAVRAVGGQDANLVAERGAALAQPVRLSLQSFDRPVAPGLGLGVHGDPDVHVLALALARPVGPPDRIPMRAPALVIGADLTLVPVAQDEGTGLHAVNELSRHALERAGRQGEPQKAQEGEADVEGDLRPGLGSPAGGCVDLLAHLVHERAPGRRLLNVQEKIAGEGKIETPVGPGHVALDVVQIEFSCHGVVPLSSR